ncbi:hypothetical protein B0H17DRAFT_1128790 [Mycena rosella]|uniref:Uncharacterized protein n=1 Tax=Mycena rosella TaxID=1033263 RepID=A0AAD7DVJ5_MYCRO|nr:hypothetical protein B0H17DRAFT_1128790 [Mycena rosella]
MTPQGLLVFSSCPRWHHQLTHRGWNTLDLPSLVATRFFRCIHPSHTFQGNQIKFRSSPLDIEHEGARSIQFRRSGFIRIFGGGVMIRIELRRYFRASSSGDDSIVEDEEVSD